MKNYKITKLFFTLCFLLAFADCETSHESLGIRVTDFTKDEWIKIHGESYKSWKLTEIIIPEKFRDDPGLINQTCIADDIYIFSIPTLPGYKGVEEVKIELGDTRCFETFSEAERFEAKLFYYPYTLNGVDVFKITFFLDKCSITDNVPVGTTTRCTEDAYPLVELTEDRVVFSNATFIGEQTFGFVFEKIEWID